MAVSEFLNAIGWGVVDPLKSIWMGIVGAVPGIIAALVVLIVGYLIALLISSIVEKLLGKIKFDEWVFEKTRMSHAVGRFDLTHVLGLLAKWYIIVLFLGAAAEVVALGTLSSFLTKLSEWIPQVIVGVVIGLFGVLAGMYVEKRVVETKAKGAKIVAAVAKWVIYVFTALIVLDQVGVQVAMAQNSFLIILGGVILMLALLVGISFGLAFRDDAKKIISDVKKKL
jgi:hypothetical protein